MNKKSKVIDVDSDLEELNEEKKNLESKTNKKMNDKENERMANSY